MLVSIDLEIKTDYKLVPNIKSLMSILWVDANYYIVNKGLHLAVSFMTIRSGPR